MSAVSECIEFYKELLKIQSKFLSDLYNKMFEKLNKENINDLYKVYMVTENENKREYVYFMYNEVTKLIKIGRSCDPKQRLNSINSVFKTQFGIENKISLIGLICVPSGNSSLVEKMLHEKYKNHNKNGEWFNISREQVSDLLHSDFVRKVVDENHTYYIYDEDLNSSLLFKPLKEKDLNIFALDTLDNYTIQISEGNLNGATMIKRHVHTKLCGETPYYIFGIDDRNIERPFSGKTDNKSWEIFKWLFINHYILLPNKFCSQVVFSEYNMDYLYYEDYIRKLLRKDGYYDNLVTE